jgi:catechol 2,3-dioxygenase-like lactoylglutathione lyase family enzyme
MEMKKALVFVTAIVLAATAGTTNAQSGRPKIVGIAYVKVKVTDVEKARAFYGGILGLREGAESCKGVASPCFGVSGSQHVELVRTADTDKSSFLAEIGLEANSVEQILGYLTAQGVPASKILRRPDGMKYLEVLDAEHNKLVFVEGMGSGTEAAPTGAISNRLFHVGFVVNDLKTEQHFYEDILGFKLYWRGGFKDDGTDWYEIQTPDGHNWIEFMLNISPTADHKERGIQNHFSLGVTSSEATAQKLRAKGAKAFDGPEVGRDGKSALDIYDPDDTRVELMEFTPTGKVCCSEYTGTHPKP